MLLATAETVSSTLRRPFETLRVSIVALGSLTLAFEDLPRRGEEVAVVHGRRRLRGDEHGRVGGILKPRLERPGAGVVDRGADRQHHDRERQRGERHDGTVLVAEERAAENAHRVP